eukprot:1150847-Pelagomonas_calceolata.AAC.2
MPRRMFRYLAWQSPGIACCFIPLEGSYGGIVCGEHCASRSLNKKGQRNRSHRRRCTTGQGIAGHVGGGGRVFRTAAVLAASCAYSPHPCFVSTGSQRGKTT